MLRAIADRSAKRTAPIRCLVGGDLAGGPSHDGTLINGIDQTLSGEKVNGYPIWTSTLPNGEAWEDKLDCENWSTSWPEENGRQGIGGYTDSRWSDDELLSGCGSGGFLYCFEQE